MNPPRAATLPLDAAQRTSSLERLRGDELDVLVVGGGVVGAGTALDAASRGLRVGLVEARDYAAGTSSRSSKLFHGGLRYLEQLDLGLVREALSERALALDNLCPHLAKPVPFVYPVTSRFDRLYAGLGFGVYHLLGAGKHVPDRLRYLDREQVRESFPSVDPTVVRGGYRFHEGVVDDARHTLFLVRTAVSHGASCVNDVRADALIRDGERVTGVVATDLTTGEELRIGARATVLAAGVWSEEMRSRFGIDVPFTVRPSKGIHLLVPRGRIRSSTGLVTRTATSLLFVIPWGAHWILGTTDTPWELEVAHPAASSQDIDYVLEQVNALLDEPVAREDVVGVYAGLRPLIAGRASSTTRLSREHVVARLSPGLTMVAGGKYTTYRTMAQHVVDTAAADLPRPVGASQTRALPLVGAHRYAEMRSSIQQVAGRSGLPAATVERLLDRYGDLVDELVGLMTARPDLREPLLGAPGYLRAEIHYAASHEGARHLDDVLTRRTRISIEVPDRGWRAAGEAADLVAEVLGWDSQHRVREVRLYRDRVAAEIASQDQANDVDAHETRLQASDVRLRG